MERNRDQNHSAELFGFCASKLLERAGYYGLRSIMILYMVGETINMSRQEASKLYGMFTGALILSQVLGGVLGDLLLGNKKALIIGGLLQATGAFCFCIPSITGIYVALGLVVLGGGLYTPNILAQIGKLYFNKQKLLHSGFAVLYLAIEMGAFFGPLLIASLSERLNYIAAFGAAGILILMSVMISLFLKEQKPVEVIENNTQKPNGIYILLALLLIGVFWSLYQLADPQVYELGSKFSSVSTLNIPSNLWNELATVVVLPVGVFVVIIWSFFYSNEFMKLGLGFLLAALSYALIILIPETPTDQYVPLFLISLFLMSIAEYPISPVTYSILSRYSNIKYLSIFMGLSLAAPKWMGSCLNFFTGKFASEPLPALQIGLISMGIIGMGLLIYAYTTREKFRNVI